VADGVGAADTMIDPQPPSNIIRQLSMGNSDHDKDVGL
jgi:hypothetical protein